MKKDIVLTKHNFHSNKQEVGNMNYIKKENELQKIIDALLDNNKEVKVIKKDDQEKKTESK